MLLLLTKNVNVYEISKILVKYRIKASIVNETIYIDGNLPDELLNSLFDKVAITGIQNFNDENKKIEMCSNTSPISVESPIASTKTEDVNCIVPYKQKVSEPLEEIAEIKQEELADYTPFQTTTPVYALKYPTVNRGEVYLCDFGEMYGAEQSGKRPVIVVQNDTGNKHSPTTIVIPCTTKPKKQLPTHFEFYFSDETMVNYNNNSSNFYTGVNVAMGEQIHTVDKSRLLKYMGTMTSCFMSAINNIIGISLELSKNLYMAKEHTPIKQTFEELNTVQREILTFVNTEELYNVCKDDIYTEKISRLLELFGFDMSKRGVELLNEAISLSLNCSYYNLETLSKEISTHESNIDSTEVKRLIVARVKERFKFKKAPTSDFIRLINNLIKTKGEICNE